MRLQQLFLRVFLFMEVVLIGYYSLVGDKGFFAIKKIVIQQEKLKNLILQEKNEIMELQQEINNWKTNDFYKEQYLREQLQMGKTNEEIYVLD